VSTERVRRVVVGSADREIAGTGRVELLTVRTDAGGAVTVTPTDAVRTGPVAFLAAHPTLPIVYAASQDAAGGVVTGYLLEGDALREHGVGRGGGGPAHVAVSTDGRHVLTADYGSSSVTLYGLDADGTVSDALDRLQVEGSGPSARQESPHPHQVLEVDGAFLVPDLGVDAVRRIEITASGALRETDRFALPAGSGPRHAVVADGLLYVACELSAEVRWDDAARPSGFARGIRSSRSGADEIAPSAIRAGAGTIVVGNRGPGTVLEATRTADGLGDLRETPSGGTWPRDLVLDEDLLLVADSRADEVSVVGPRPPGEVLATHRVSGPNCVLVLTGAGG